MPKVAKRVELDAATWERIDAARRDSGLSSDEVIDSAVRRVLGGRALASLFERVRERSDLTDGEAADLVAAEKAEMRKSPAAGQDPPARFRQE